ncbi:MAG: sensor domain-containing diguanylate cyclase [Alphaproteobacteria bacterium]|nr:sensor domain-containing diguanylate cyclase [Alphaproteobacteria bacterium]MBV9370809.1 sensor domain-containing diguanylate cyclase [Alphaproteobacteria bacterium]MBV9900111.1 sensor domain-containing diguanylate cyclase [Alphaproteobacteria bacterium]
MREPKFHDEEGRIAALIRYDVLDTPPEAPFEKITLLVKDVLQVPICAVSLVDREQQWFKSIQGLDTRETPRSISFCAHTIRTDEALIVTDALQDPRFSTNPLVLGEPHIRSYAGVPLQSPDGYNVGALCAIDVVPREFSDAQLGILRSFASLVVDELELRRIAERDHLTGALTRRGFVEQVKKEISRCRRHGRESVLVLLDIDHFKRVNDGHGHPAGDSVLKAAASACLEGLRENDLLGRLGGEEFGILLTETDAGGGLEAAEKLRKAIAGLRVDVAGGLRVTASFGVAPFAASVSKPEDWIARADEALYSAKRGGRNRCVAANALADAIAA